MRLEAAYLVISPASSSPPPLHFSSCLLESPVETTLADISGAFLKFLEPAYSPEVTAALENKITEQRGTPGSLLASGLGLWGVICGLVN